MARKCYSPEVQKRTKCLFEALLAYANDELEDCENLRIQVYWQDTHELIVRTQVRFLAALTALDPNKNKLSDAQIKL